MHSLLISDPPSHSLPQAPRAEQLLQDRSDISLCEVFIRIFRLSHAQKFLSRNLTPDYLGAIENDPDAMKQGRIHIFEAQGNFSSMMFVTYVSVMINLLLQLVILIVFPVYDSGLQMLFSNTCLVILMATISAGFFHCCLNGSALLSALIVCAGYFCKIVQVLLAGPVYSYYQYVAVITYFHTFPILLSHLLDSQLMIMVVCLFLVAVWSTMQMLEFLYLQLSDFNGLETGIESTGSAPGIYLSGLNLILFYWFQMHQNNLLFQRKVKDLKASNRSFQVNISSFEVHIASLVHELKHPLLSMTGSLEVLRKTLKDETTQQEELFEVASTSVDHLNTMITNMLEFSKLRANKIELNLASVNLLKMTKKVIKMHYFKAKDNSNRLTLHVSTNFPKKLIADEQRIKQILINLMSNAIKFTQGGLVQVRLGWKPVPAFKSLHPNELGASDEVKPEQYEPEHEGEPQIQYEEQRSLFKKLENKSVGSGNDFDSQDNHSFIGSYKEEVKDAQGYNHYSSYPRLLEKQTIESEPKKESKLDSRKQSSFTELNGSHDRSPLFQNNGQSGNSISAGLHDKRNDGAIQLYTISNENRRDEREEYYDQINSLPNELYQFNIRNENIVNEMETVKFGEYLDNFLLGPGQQSERKPTHSREDQRFQTPRNQEESKGRIHSIEKIENQFNNSPRTNHSTSMDLVIATSRSDIPNLNQNMDRLDANNRTELLRLKPRKSQQALQEQDPQRDMEDEKEEQQLEEDLEEKKWSSLQVACYMKQKTYNMSIKKQLSDISHENESDLSSSIEAQAEKQPLDTSPSFTNHDQKESNGMLMADSILSQGKEEVKMLQHARQFSSDTLNDPPRAPDISQKPSFADYQDMLEGSIAQTVTEKKVMLLSSEQAQLSLDNHKVTAFFPEDLNEQPKVESIRNLEEEKVVSLESHKEEAKTKNNSFFANHAFGDSQSEYQHTLNPKNSQKKSHFHIGSHNSCKEEDSSNYFHSSTGVRKKTSNTFNQLKNTQNDIKRFHSLIQPCPRRTSLTKNENAISSNTQLNLDNGSIIIEVKDTGKGISEEGLKRLFKPFEQEDRTISKNYGGTGLGLCICHDLVSIMNGTIKVESQRRLGTHFTIKIPMKRSNDLSGMIDDQELDLTQFDMDLASFELVLINNQKSFELQQIKRALANVGQPFQVFEASQVKDGNLFHRKNSVKSVIIDSSTLRSKRQLLQQLSQLWDDIEITEDQSNYCQNATVTKLMKKIPIIVIASEFENEQKVPKGEQLFMLRAPLDQFVIQKIMIAIKKYYYSRTGEEKGAENQKELESYQRVGYSEASLPLLGLGSSESNHSAMPGKHTPNIVHQSFKFGRMNSLQTTDQFKSATLGRTRKVSHNPNTQPTTSKLNDASSPTLKNRDIRKQNSTKLLNEKMDQSEMEYKTLSKQEALSMSSSVTHRQRSSFKVAQNLPKTLIVNDEKMILDVIEKLVQCVAKEMGKDMQVLKAKNGRVAVELFQQHSNIKCIFMDVNMPVMNGYDSTQKIRLFEEERKSSAGASEYIPAYIVGVSGQTDNQHIQKCMQSGMNEVLLTTLSMRKVKELLLKVYS